MLISLHVKNLALIEETEVFFGQGLNILTGETGAGKSVVLGSVALALGQKADRDMIRTGADYALIELNFEVTEAARRKLAEMDIPVDDDQVILQRRVMPARSICRINGETVNVRILKELAGLLIDIHGQHDSQVLLQTKRHLEILDGYAGEQLSEVKAAYHKEWQKKNAIAKEILENGLDEAARKREISLAEFELEEIESAALLEKEDEELEKDYRRMVNGRRIVETLNLVHALTGYESSESAGEAAGRALRELSGIVSYDEELEEIYRQLSEVDGLLNDFNRTVSDYLSDIEFEEETFRASDIEFEEETFRAVEKRLDDINRLKDKYGRSISEVLLYAKRRQEELDRLNHQDEWLSAKRAELARAQERLTELAGKLTGIRKKGSTIRMSGCRQSAQSSHARRKGLQSLPESLQESVKRRRRRLQPICRRRFRI